jgi:hypothetical protein
VWALLLGGRAGPGIFSVSWIADAEELQPEGIKVKLLLCEGFEVGDDGSQFEIRSD